MLAQKDINEKKENIFIDVKLFKTEHIYGSNIINSTNKNKLDSEYSEELEDGEDLQYSEEVKNEYSSEYTESEDEEKVGKFEDEEKETNFENDNIKKEPIKKHSQEEKKNVSEAAKILQDVYMNLMKEDFDVSVRAISACKEYMLMNKNARKPYDGKVARRTPLGPCTKLASALKEDPAKFDSPLQGRLICLFTTTGICIFVFLQALIYNKTKYGKTIAPFKDNPMLGPYGETLYDLGGLNTNAMRNDDELYRLFWAFWMHSGWIHIIFNLLTQSQLFLMYEPDWGFWRSFFLFTISAVTGNLISSTADPCTTTVGSSGGLFGLMGGIIVYCIEYWYTIPQPYWILGFSSVVTIISIIVGFTQTTDNWAHLGGLLGGVLFSFATISTFSITNSKIKENVKKKKTPAKPKGYRVFYNHLPPNCSHRRFEWFIRLASLFVTWLITFLLLLNFYEYQPIGHVSFSKSDSCSCCYANVRAVANPKKQGIPYYCFFETGVPVNWHMSWGNFCQMSINEISKITPQLPFINSVGLPVKST